MTQNISRQPSAGPSATALLRLGQGLWPAKVLLSALELELFHVLAREGPLSAEALRTQLNLHPRGARDFFDTLVALNVLERENDRYALTPIAAACFVDAAPANVGEWLRQVGDYSFRSWPQLTTALRTGQPQIAAAGGDFFVQLYENPEQLRRYALSMTAITREATGMLVQRFPWQRYRTVIDVGTGQNGMPTVPLAQAYPHLSGGSFDQPVCAAVYAEYAAAQGGRGQLRFIAGDPRRDPLPSADVLLVGQLMHWLTQEEKQDLIARAYAALPAEGALIIVDTLIDDDRRTAAIALQISLAALLQSSGACFTGAECCAWLRQAGFRETHVTPLAGSFAMVVGLK